MVFYRWVIVFSFLLLPTLQALKIEITEGTRKAIPIAVLNFQGDDLEGSISDVIRQDLQSCGLFRSLDPGALGADLTLDSSIDYAKWQSTGANFVVIGAVERQISGFVVNFIVYDIAAKQNVLALSVDVDDSLKWRRAGHMIADAILSRITGEGPFFNSKIAFVKEEGPKGRRHKTIMVSDWDGHNMVSLTSGKKLVLTPRFSPNNEEVAYLSYEGKAPQVYLVNIYTKEKKKLGNFSGMTFAPRFSPDGRFMVMSLAKDGLTAIYKFDLTTHQLVQLTPHEGINTSPCFSPDGMEIVFTSDRDGIEQLYIMASDGTNVHRISFGGGKYSQPVWSPRGDMIAFTKQIVGKGFFIGLMDTNGTQERVIAGGYLVEGSSWSPNGRYLMFTREHNIKGSKGLNNIYMIDMTGYHELLIKTDASDIFWSVLLSPPLATSR